MAQKRMFSLSVVDTDSFLEMPITSRLLYYELGMRADDDGFVDNWKKIMLFTGLKEDDLKILILKNFIIPFESGVIVIRHWRMNNYLQNDRTKATIYQKEKSLLNVDSNNVYTMDTQCIHSIDKNSIEENSIDKNINNILSSKLDQKEEKNNLVEEIINYLNLKCGTNYKSSTTKTKKLIETRLKEKFTIDDFKIVIDKKTMEWKGTEYEKFLRPETLFGNKFEGYLNQKEKEVTTRDIAKTIDWSDF